MQLWPKTLQSPGHTKQMLGSDSAKHPLGAAAGQDLRRKDTTYTPAPTPEKLPNTEIQCGPSECLNHLPEIQASRWPQVPAF